MLDAFIIERIRQQRESQESIRKPLRVEIPLRSDPDDVAYPDDEPGEPERGVVIIDDTI